MVICLERGADLHMVQLMPLPLTVSCFSKIQIGFTFLVAADPDGPGKGPLNGCVCVCVCVISPQRLTLETSNFVHGSAMRSLSLVMSKCSLSGRVQGHVSNFYIVDFKKFRHGKSSDSTSVYNSTVVGLFMTHCLQLNLQLHTIDLVRTCRISSFCTVAW